MFSGGHLVVAIAPPITPAKEERRPNFAGLLCWESLASNVAKSIVQTLKTSLIYG